MPLHKPGGADMGVAGVCVGNRGAYAQASEDGATHWQRCSYTL